MLKTILLSTVFLAGINSPVSSLAHHSHSDYELERRFEFIGTVVEVHWENPHIMFDVDNGLEVMRIEWVTIAGAEKTGVAPDQIQAGDQLTVIGSRNRNSALRTISAIRELAMPAKHWRWISPSESRTSP